MMLSSSPAPCSIPILGPAAAAKHGCFPHAASHLEGNATTGDSSSNSACSTGISAANMGRGQARCVLHCKQTEAFSGSMHCI